MGEAVEEVEAVPAVMPVALKVKTRRMERSSMPELTSMLFGVSGTAAEVPGIAIVWIISF